MPQMYTQRRRAAAESVGAERMPESAGGLPPEVLAGRAAPGPELMGSRADLPEAVRSKMESSFGADFSGVQLYESQAVADAGAQAVLEKSSSPGANAIRFPMATACAPASATAWLS